MASSSASMVNGDPQVFLNFRGDELRNRFICFLEDALNNENIKYFIDTKTSPGDDMKNLFKKIEESKVALAVFSERYTESNWCLNELVKIMQRVDEKKLRIFPIFFYVKVDDVKNQTGEFGKNLYRGKDRDISNMLQWKNALRSVPTKIGLRLGADRSESDFITEIVAKLKTVIAIDEGGEGTSMLSTSISSTSSSGNDSSRDINQPKAPLPCYEMLQCLKKLEEKIDFDCEETQIVGIIGMPGTGKTTLAEMHLHAWNHRFVVNEIFRGFRENSNDHDWVKNTLLNAQVNRPDDEKVKVLVVLDDVSDKKQLEFLRTNRQLVIKKGSKIVITTRDKGLIEGLVDDTYVVPGLNDKEALQLFNQHAFKDQDYPPTDSFTKTFKDLRLPYSKIQRVWRGTKDTPNLKLVDLSHSTNLTDLSALSNAKSLRRLSLEGCTKLDKLAEDIENMKSLDFLNLRGCTSLLSLPKMKNFISLKTLILSDCSNFHEFQVVSENLKYLHLDGTAIKGLPPSIQNLGRLIVLNLKDCKKLESIPDCLDKLKALEELILSGCSMLRNFPDVMEIMENLQILLLDGTSVKELPTILHTGNSSINQVALQRIQLRMNGLSLLRRLCLSRNYMISSLQSSISQLYHLKSIDLKYCKNLTSLSTLPPNLQCLDAHACTSLKTVASPLATLSPLTEQAPSSFIFTNCEKLEHVAKNEIMCYALSKSRLILDALKRQKKGLVFEALVATCFPGSEVPAWFDNKASGAVLKPDLPRHWSESGFVGVALCAIVSFQDYNIQNIKLMVKCICDYNNVVGTSSTSFFDCNVGGLSEAGDEQHIIKSTHVFIGFTSWLNINKCQEVGLNEGCIPTKASIEFKVTDDGTCEAANCEVLKCGFSLVCESDNGSWDENVDANTMVEDRQGESRFLGLLRRRGWFLTL